MKDQDRAVGGQLKTAERVLLPAAVKPEHYDLTIDVDLVSFKFKGTCGIELQVLEQTDKITLHSIDLDVQRATTYIDDQPTSSSPELQCTPKEQTITLLLGQAVVPGQRVKVKLEYTGELKDDMAGFYRSKAASSDRHMAVTHFEPTSARRAFPCFDEPALKASFSVSLVADADLTCLSNMDVASITTIPATDDKLERKAVCFRKSPPMSTYLVALMVADLKCVSSDAFRVPVNVWMTPDQSDEDAEFALDLAAKTLKFYEDTFECEYALPKLDMVAVPDFAIGAMENWGLVFFQVVDLLFNSRTGSTATKERIAAVVQHELAHQWFGNLVTMKYWDGLWLKEGFATWMAMYSGNEFFPEWKVWEKFVADTLQSALDMDSLRSSHAVEVFVRRGEDVSQIFDAISYHKGCSIIRMISQYLGEGCFIQGVKQYLHQNAFSTATSEDLWRSLSKVSGKDVESIMAVWTQRVGYPIITVVEDDVNDTIIVEQRRFLKTGDVVPGEDQTLYPIELGLKTTALNKHPALLTERLQSFKIEGGLEGLKTNSNHSGLFRTKYSPERLMALATAAGKSELSVEDRAGLVADAGALAMSGYQRTSDLLAFLQHFRNENSYVVWSQIHSILDRLRSTWIFEEQPIQDALKRFQLDLCSTKARELGWQFDDDDDHTLSQLRTLIFQSCAKVGDPAIEASVADIFQQFAQPDHTLHPNLRASVYDLYARNSTPSQFEALISRYRQAPTAEERNACLHALGQPRDETLIERTLTLLLSNDFKTQDIPIPFESMSATRQGIEMRWSWLYQNWDTLVARLPPNKALLGMMVSIALQEFVRVEQVEKACRFFDDKDTEGFEQALTQSVDVVRAKQKWLDSDAEDVKQWLRAYGFLT